MQKGVLISNPADRVRPPGRRYKSPKGKTWTAEQVKTFLDMAAEDRLYAAWVVAATTGLRRGEVLGIRWEDLDLERGWLSICQTVVMVKDRPQLSTPKTGSGSRSIHLTPQALAALRSHRIKQAQERLALGLGTSKLVFVDIDGGFINPNSFTRRFQLLARVAGLPSIRLHDLRHSCATILLQRKVPVKVVSEILGHANTAITNDIYSHVIPSMKEEATGQIEAAIFGTGGNKT